MPGPVRRPAGLEPMNSSLEKLVRGYRSVLEPFAGLALEGNHRCWLVGGAVRDLAMGLSSRDLDFAVDGNAGSLARGLSRELGATLVVLKEEEATYRIVCRGLVLDLAGLRAPDLASDLSARDFTINAVALELGDLLAARGAFIDPLGGLGDLAAGRLRAAGPGVLASDPLRVLRAFRFMSALPLEPDSGLTKRLVQNAQGLASVAPERIGHEWLLTMAGKRVGPAVRAMEECGVLPVLLPELEPGRGMEQNPYHHLDVRRHNLACLSHLADLARDPEPWFGGLSKELTAYLKPARRRALLMTAALLHDVGKPATREETGPGWASFHRHDTEGAGLAFAACRRLGLSKADSSLVASLVAAHMRPFHLMGAQRRGSLTKRGIRRLIQTAGGDLPGWFALAMADTLAGHGPERPDDAEQVLIDLYREVARLRDDEIAAALAEPPLIDGWGLMAHLGITSGPLVGELLHRLREAQLDGDISTRAEALELAARELSRINASSG